jgi:ferredoxin-thioredoxin reductase catalytic subunit
MTNQDAERVVKYYLNPDEIMTQELLQGLSENQVRYGYRTCPCRLAKGVLDADRDIICPCDYREADVAEFGNCYCGLFVNEQVFKTGRPVASIPERRKRYFSAVLM